MVADRKLFRRALLLGAAIGAVLGGSPSAAAQGADEAAAPAEPVEERQSYALRLMMQVYDGRRDFSHTQMLGVGRVRKGDRSFTQFDFGDGAVTLTQADGELAASRFMNVSPTEKAVLYDYRTKTIAGDDEIAEFHNQVVRPLLGQAPELGADAAWSVQVPIAGYGGPGAGEAAARIELSRDYFVHEGKPMVLIHYAIPAFSYADASGRRVVHWGQGISLTDPGFGMIYLNSALHRAVARADGGAAVPYRYARTMVAANPDGSAMLDYRTVPQLEKFVDAFFSEEAMQVVPTEQRSLDDGPIGLANKLDMLALAIAEDGANEAPIATAAQTSANRGAEVTSTQGARAYASDAASFGNPDQRETEILPHEAVHTTQQRNTVGGSSGAGPAESSLEAEVTEETVRALQRSTSEGTGLTSSLGTNADPNAAFGRQGPDSPYFDDAGVTGEDGSLAQSQYWLDKANAIFGGAVSRMDELQRLEYAEQLADEFISDSRALGSRINSLTQAIEDAEDALREGAKSVIELSPGAQLLQNRYEKAAADLGRAEGLYEGLLAHHAELSRAGQRIPENLRGALAAAEKEMRLAGEYRDQMEVALQSSLQDGAYTVAMDLADPDTKRLSDRLSSLYRELGQSHDALVELGTRADGLTALVRSTPVQEAARFLERLGNSPAGKVLDGLSNALNVYTTGKATYNVYNASTTNMSSGTLDLSRSHTVGELGLDILALAGNAVSGNAAGFYSDAVALVSGSISDIYVANKAWNDTIVDNERRHEELMANMRRLTRMIQEQEKEKLADLKAEDFGLYTSAPTTDGGVSDPNWEDPRIDPDTGLPKPGYWAYLKENSPGTLASFGIDPEAPVGGWPDGVGPEHRPADYGQQPQIAENEPSSPPVFDINDGIDYPTAPPRDPDEIDSRDDADGPRTTPLTPQQLAEIEREQRKAQAQADLDAYQAQKLAERETGSSLPGSYEFRTSTLETSELLTSAFDIKPVVFEPVTFDMPVFDEDGDLFVRNPDGTTSLRKVGPDEFEMTPFDPPEISRFPPTDPDDLDGYPGAGQFPAFTFDTMSGTQPDISQWAEWLETQNVALLTQLAIAAGYPSLAWALGDAENIIRLSQDEGYRAYANRGPNCAGYTGCTGSIGPWKLAYATVNLGDILAKSREIFSTGGFSDIGISGFNLMYLLRDHGVQDGDLIDVEISQFGRSIFELRGHYLLNAGSPFNVNLQPGVAQMVITALNEGSATPNTAQVTIDNVVRGEATQTYSLNTGQTAVLRIESNAEAIN